MIKKFGIAAIMFTAAIAQPATAADRKSKIFVMQIFSDALLAEKICGLVDQQERAAAVRDRLGVEWEENDKDINVATKASINALKKLGREKWCNAYVDGMSRGEAAKESMTTEVVAVAKVLAGGSIGENDASNVLIKPVAGRLLARGVVADQNCHLKNQGKLATLVNSAMGIEFDTNNNDDKAILKFTTMFAKEDYQHEGQQAWCVDYIARATPAENMFRKFLK